MNRISLGVCVAVLLLATTASAITVTVDGIRTAGEYTGANSGIRVLPWFNGHESIYTLQAGYTNPLYWEINNLGGAYSLNMFFEVPAFARRMIWGSGIDYDGTNFDPAWKIPKTYLDAYLAGTHHDSVKMDYGTQTSSEYFKLNGINLDKINWQDVDDNGLSDKFTWKTSLQYLIDNGISTTSSSLAFDTTASIELMWTGLSLLDAQSLVNGITNMELHLSDEARGLPSILPPVDPPTLPPTLPPVNDPPPAPTPQDAMAPIPEPATVAMLAVGAVFVGSRFSRRRRNQDTNA